jgi:hypothetical protein
VSTSINYIEIKIIIIIIRFYSDCESLKCLLGDVTAEAEAAATAAASLLERERMDRRRSDAERDARDASRLVTEEALRARVGKSSVLLLCCLLFLVCLLCHRRRSDAERDARDASRLVTEEALRARVGEFNVFLMYVRAIVGESVFLGFVCFWLFVVVVTSRTGKSLSL